MARTVDSALAPKTRRTFAGLPFLSPCRGKERPRIAVYWFPTAPTMGGMAGPFSFVPSALARRLDRAHIGERHRRVRIAGGQMGGDDLR